jgi:hypothetical protein
VDKKLTSFERFRKNVSDSLPKLSGELMDKWSEYPEALKEVLVDALGAFPESNYPTYQVTVDFARSVKKMIADGEYDLVNCNITARHFPSKDKDKVKESIHLVRFEPGLRSSEEIIRELDNRGLRPVVLKELLALGATYRDTLLGFDIVALGSTWYDESNSKEVIKVACIVVSQTNIHIDRQLDLYDADGTWTSEWRFAAVPKGT